MNAIPESYRQLRQRAAWWQEGEGLIAVAGADAASYLQTQLTQDILALEVGETRPAALVNRKGQLQALMQVCRVESKLFWLLPTGGAEALFAHLEAFHFVEDVSLSVESAWLRLRLEGPASLEVLRELSGHPVRHPGERMQSLAIPGGSVWLLPGGYTGEVGVWLLCRQDYAAGLRQGLASVAVLSDEALEIARIEAGQPRWGQDMDSGTLLPETGLEKATVSYDKGCYLGQEVIARIRSYGVVPRGLIGLVLPEALEPGPLQLAGKDVGRLSACVWSPQLQSWIGLAYLHKSLRENDRLLSLSLKGQSVEARVRRLPFYAPPAPEIQAQSLLEQALDVFAGEQEDAAIPLLEAALALNPQLMDAYEALGVILSRQGRLDEAIEVMLELSRRAPQEPMAHTNLSRFYMLQGDKATAETHMAEATRLNLQRSQQQVQAQAQAAREQEQKQELIAMFREVLETEDSDDLVANFGLGKALLESGEAAEAVPLLEKAVRVDPLYSAAWLQLGKAREACGALSAAGDAYRHGMEAAAEKGDLMPLKEMEARLLALPQEAR